MQPGGCVIDEWGEGSVADDLEHGRGLGDRGDRAKLVFPNAHVAGEQEPDSELRRQRLVCERRVARSKNHVRSKLLIELLLQRRLNIYLCEDAESFLLEGLG